MVSGNKTTLITRKRQEIKLQKIQTEMPAKAWEAVSSSFNKRHSWKKKKETKWARYDGGNRDQSQDALRGGYRPWNRQKKKVDSELCLHFSRENHWLWKKLQQVTQKYHELGMHKSWQEYQEQKMSKEQCSNEGTKGKLSDGGITSSRVWAKHDGYPKS